MGEIKDAIDTMHDLKAEFAETGIYSTKRSISASAMEGTANFPVLVEDSISLDDGILVSRAAEKKYASFLLTVLTMDPYLEVEKGQTPSASEYLKQFHQNMRVKSPTKGVHMNMVDFLKESYDVNDMDYGIMESEAFKMAHTIYEGVKGSVPQDKNVLLNYTVEEMVTPDSLNERFFMGVPVSEANKGGGFSSFGEFKGSDNYKDLPKGDNKSNFEDTDKDWFDSFYGNNSNIKNNSSHHSTTSSPNGATVGGKINVGSGKVDVGSGNVNVGSGKVKVGSGKVDVGSGKVDINIKTSDNRQNTQGRQMTVRDRGTQWKPLTDNDCKKANDLVPTLLHIRVYPIDKYTREELSPIDFVMGVKATLHPIPVNELARMVVAGMRNENLLFNFIRWTTGEIKFFKDFVFALDTLKMDAKDSGKDVTGWRPALKRRRNSSKSKLRFSKNSIMPNATLVVSQGAAEYVKENYGYDLNDERIINRMMEVYFLLGYISVNTVNQRATFKFDGIDSTDTYTFDTLKRENQSDDKAFKNMMKMLGRSM